jgi:hypothetical protein
MFRKITIAAVSVTAFALMLCGNDNSASQAFARGGRGGHGVHRGHGGRGFHNHRGYYNRNYGRSFGWGYPSYYAYGYPAVGYSVVSEPELPVVAPPVATACTTFAPIYSGTDSYASYWGYGRNRNHYRHDGGFRGHGGHGGRGRR